MKLPLQDEEESWIIKFHLTFTKQRSGECITAKKERCEGASRTCTNQDVNEKQTRSGKDECSRNTSITADWPEGADNCLRIRGKSLWRGSRGTRWREGWEGGEGVSAGRQNPSETPPPIRTSMFTSGSCARRRVATSSDWSPRVPAPRFMWHFTPKDCSFSC